MGRIIAIAGLPASGKTTYAKNLQAKESAILIDDPKAWEDIEAVLLTNQDRTIIITDPHFCSTGARINATTRLFSWGFEVTWIFFENDLNACIENYKRRHHGKMSADLAWFSKNYTIPENSTIIPVWKQL